MHHTAICNILIMLLASGVLTAIYDPQHGSMKMVNQHGFQFDDPDSRTRSGVLNVVIAQASEVAPFDTSLFEGFSSMRALTYTSSIPMIMRLLTAYDFDDFECVFGHSGILSRDAAEILAFQQVVDEKLNKGFVAMKGMSPERREAIYDRAVSGSARFYVVKDAIAHAKIYLLESDQRKRVIIGSANLSETAFSGRQAETLVVFDEDKTAWRHYAAQYEAVRDVSSNHLPLRKQPISVGKVIVEETPALRDAKDDDNGITMYVPAEGADEAEFTVPTISAEVEYIKPVFKKALADQRPNKQGDFKITPKIVGQMVRIALSRQADDTPKTYLTREGDRFILSGNEMRVDVDTDEVKRDVANWLKFFGNYELGFTGDVPRLQKDYFTFMCWFYFAPLMCDIRNAAIRSNTFSFDQPMFAVLYGSSNCGKTSLVRTLMTSMFSRWHDIPTTEFTVSKLKALQASYKRFPVVFDDVARERFGRHADEIIKDETISYAEYPCFTLSMNAEARSFKPEIVKRCLMIYTRTSLPGNEIAARSKLQRSVSRIQEDLTTSLYREYLKRALTAMDAAIQSEDDVDALELSSSILCDIFNANLPAGAELPEWCKVMTLEEYQRRAFDRPRMRLSQLIHKDKYSNERKPTEGCWTISGNNIIVSVPMMQASRIKEDIPDWIIDDTASVAGQIAMQRNLTEAFLREHIRRPFHWNPFRR